MKLRYSLLSALASIAMVAAAAHAQEIDTISNGSGPGFNAGYADGDLILSFANVSDASGSGNGDVLFNLGTVSSFTGLAAGTYSVAGFNGSVTAGQPTPGFGSSEINANLTVPSTATFWSVFGALTNSSKQLWLSGVTAQVQASTPVQQTLAGQIAGIGGAGVGGVNPDGSSFDFSQTTGNLTTNNGHTNWTNFNTTAFVPVSATSNQLGLYSLLPGTGGAGSSTELGVFTLTDTAGNFSLSFTATAIPEPSTYAAILGALTVGFVLVRRRFGAGRLNALA